MLPPSMLRVASVGNSGKRTPPTSSSSSAGSSSSSAAAAAAAAAAAGYPPGANPLTNPLVSAMGRNPPGALFGRCRHRRPC